MKKLLPKHLKTYFIIFFILSILSTFFYYFYFSKNQILSLQSSKEKVIKDLHSTKKELTSLKNENQYKINKKLEAEIKNIHSLYNETIISYQDIQDLKSQKQKVNDLETSYANIVKDLSDLNYSSAESKLKDLNTQIQKQTAILAASYIPAVVPTNTQATNIQTSNSLPNSGYNRQQVQTDNGTFTIDIISADLNSTKVLADTASEGNCSDNCPVLPLNTYATRSNAYAAINGTFFCPTEYPSCAGKTNSFDTLLMNKNKTYFNSDNNVYSTVPAVIFKDNWSRFVSRSLEWGRDTSVDSVIAMQPLLVFNNQVAYTGSDNSKFNSKGPRCFIAGKGNMAYIGIVHNATMAESANVLKTLGMENAINLDEGGSTALWYNGSYIAGPGRNIPNAILFVRK